MSFLRNIGIFLALIAGITASKGRPQIRCLHNTMEIFVGGEGVTKIGLEKWSALPGCEPITTLDGGHLILLKLNDHLPCGTTRVKNKITGDTYFYHKLFIRDDGGIRRVYKVSCSFSGTTYGLDNEEDNRIVKRNVLPAEFVEPDYIEITSEISGTAPVPELSVQVRQNGRLIRDHVTVSPGAPLSMEVYLDSTSASTYGILVSYLMVTDTSDKNETIIYNGCASDAYIFENFETRTGDFLTAKFRAFKFPESNFLMFRGTVDVCLDKCQGVRCANGEIGYGRKRRAVSSQADPNKIYEVTMMTFLRVEDTEGIEEDAAIAIELLEHSVQEEQENKLSSHSRFPFFRRNNKQTEQPYTYFESNGLNALAPSLWAFLSLIFAYWL